MWLQVCFWSIGSSEWNLGNSLFFKKKWRMFSIYDRFTLRNRCTNTLRLNRFDFSFLSCLLLSPNPLFTVPIFAVLVLKQNSTRTEGQRCHSLGRTGWRRCTAQHGVGTTRPWSFCWSGELRCWRGRRWVPRSQGLLGPLPVLTGTPVEHFLPFSIYVLGIRNRHQTILKIIKMNNYMN